LVCCLWGAFALADDEEESGGKARALRIPKVGQPSSDFYNAAGSGVKIQADAEPRELSTNDRLTFKLTITNLLNPAEVEKPSLKKLPDFAGYQVDESPELDPKIDPRRRGQRVFVYKLRPSSEKQTFIPAVTFYYYDPALRVPPERPQLAFPLRRTSAIEIRVHAPSVTNPGVQIPVDVPQFALSLASGNALSPERSELPGWLWRLALVAPPFLAIGWLFAWRALYPDAARLARMKRNRAVRHALNALANVKRANAVESAGMISQIVIAYLRERFDLPLEARTQREIAEYLERIDIAPEHVEQASQLFRACDAARFGPAPVVATDLADAAERLVVALEERP